LKEQNSNINIPLCVDLDGSLIRTDILQETLFLSIRKKPWILFLLPFWFLKGISYVKYRTSQIAEPDITLLPVWTDVLNFVNEEKAKGRKIVLATAAAESTANKVAEQFGIFDEVFATTEKLNLRSENKRNALVNAFGEKGYDYIGDSHADLPVWASAHSAITINISDSLKKKTEKVAQISRSFQDDSPWLTVIFKQLRVHQWVKNLLLFLPLFLAHEFSNISSWLTLIMGFFIFSFISSSIYIFNDILDVESDRRHEWKKHRPLASGKISMITGSKIAITLLIIGFASSFIFLNGSFNIALLIYLVLTTLYSFYLKSIFAVDILVLASLYSLRIFAGGLLAEVEISKWLISFSMFVFLSLSVLKRYAELDALEHKGKEENKSRGYLLIDKMLLLAIGVSSGIISVLVFILYIASEEVVGLYSQPILLYAISPLFLLWILRLWFFSVRGEMHEDPVVFTLKDKLSYVVAILIAIIIFGAMI